MTRASNLYVSTQLYRWLKWMAEMRGETTADGMAEELLRNAILSQLPDIESVEGEYWAARHKLDSEAVEKLKSASA